MIKKIIATIFSRIILAILSLCLVIFTAQYLGPSGRGDVSLFVLNLAIVQMVNNFVGGPYLVYLTPRASFKSLLFPSYVWAFVSSIVVPFALYLCDLLSSAALLPLMLISALYSFNFIHAMILAGKQEMGKYNTIIVVQGILLLCFFLISVLFFDGRDYQSYIYALFLSYIGILFLSSIFIVRSFKNQNQVLNAISFSSILKSGFVVQLGNLVQLLTGRLSFFILDSYREQGRAEVGVYSVSLAVAEAFWLISQSVALVLYSRISNENDAHMARRITNALMKVIFIITILGLCLALFLPAEFYIYVFGYGFGEIKSTLFILGFGIVMASCGILLTSYFVGTGRPRVGVVSSSLGLAATLFFGFYLIPQYGILGAAFTASFSFALGAGYQFVLFMREAAEFGWRDYLFTKKDFNLVLSELKNIILPKQVL